jgi:hypothetical protein
MINALIIRAGIAALVTGNVSVAYSDEAPTHALVTMAAMDLSDRPQQAKPAPIASVGPLKSPSAATAEVAKSIRAQGMECPTVMNVASRGRDSYGRVFIVRCGYAPGAGGHAFSYLRVSIQANGEAIITPESNTVR